MTGTGIRPSECVVDLDAVRHNVTTLRGDDGADICVVVKADAYGHGAVAVAKAAVEAGASWLAVALVEEALVLRKAGIMAPILLLSEPPVAAAKAVCDAALSPFVYSPAFIDALNSEAQARNTTVAVHLKIDTGMGRVGVIERELQIVLSHLVAAASLRLDGVGTHLARSDENDPAAKSETLRQLEQFATLLPQVRHAGFQPRWLHAANTAAALQYPTARCLQFPGGTPTTLLRCGIGVYGLSPSVDVDAAANRLRPVLSLCSAVSFVKHITAGTPVSYGHRWRAPKDGWLATVPIGYADGVPRGLTNRATVLVNGRQLPVVGTVTMDQLMVWSGDTPIAVDDPVILIGTADTLSVRIEQWAQTLNTITYEIASQLTARLPRRYVGVSPADDVTETLR